MGLQYHDMNTCISCTYITHAQSHRDGTRSAFDLALALAPLALAFALCPLRRGFGARPLLGRCLLAKLLAK